MDSEPTARLLVKAKRSTHGQKERSPANDPRHLLQTGKAVSLDTVQLTQKSLERGHELFFGGYVYGVKVCQAGAKFYVES